MLKRHRSGLFGGVDFHGISTRTIVQPLRRHRCVNPNGATSGTASHRSLIPLEWLVRQEAKLEQSQEEMRCQQSTFRHEDPA